MDGLTQISFGIICVMAIFGNTLTIVMFVVERQLLKKSYNVFKTALLVYKALNGMSPSYIKELIVPSHILLPADCDHAIKAFLRSQNQEHPVLVIECSVLQPQDYGTYSLPDNIRLNNSSIDDFKRSLKTYLFKLAF